MSIPEKFTATIKEKKWLTADVLSVKLALDRPLTFGAGQFIMLDVPANRPRAFSIANAPKQGGSPIIHLCMKRYPESVTAPYVDSLSPTDVVTLKAPFGNFILRESERPIFFVATGVGVAPMFGMLHDEKNKKSTREKHMVFGLRDEDDLIFKKELAEMLPHAVTTLSQPSKNWTGARGRVTDHLSTLPEPSHYDFYICGAPEMVKDARALLLERGVPQEQIFFEIF